MPTTRLSELYVPPPLPSVHTRDELAAFLDTPEIAHSILEHSAELLQEDIADYLDTEHAVITPPLNLSAELFERYIDISLPTIAIDFNNSFSGSKLMGLAALRRPEQPANIVYLASPAHGLRVAQDSHGNNTLVAETGMLVLPDGTVAYGTFPKMLPVVLLETADEQLLTSCAQLELPTTLPASSARQCADKRKLPELVPEGINIPRRFDTAILDLPDRPHELVIKPSRDAQGKGILLSNGRMSQTHLLHTYNFLETHGYDPMIEERIISFPMHDPETGERLDWNVRAVVSDHEFIAMYIRADEPGQPVNRSHSAQAISLDECSDYFESHEQALQVRHVLEGATTVIANHLDEGFYGLDMTLNETMQPVIFEINAGYVGGLQTIAKFSTEQTEKLRNVQRVLDGWVSRITQLPRSNESVSISDIKLGTSLATLIDGVQIAGKTNVLKNFDLPRVHGYADRSGGFQAAINARRIACFSRDVQRTREIDDHLIQMYPLELRRQIGSLAIGTISGSSFKQLTEQINALYPDDKTSISTQAQIEANEFNLIALKIRYTDAANLDKGQKIFEPVIPRLTTLFMNELAPDLENIIEPVINQSLHTFLTFSYEDALLELHSALEDAPKEARDDLRLYEYALAVTTGNFDHADHLYESFIETDMRNVAQDFATSLGSFEYMFSDVKKVQFLNHLMFENGIILAHLDNLIYHLSSNVMHASLTDKEIQSIFEVTVAAIPFPHSAVERNWFTEILSTLTYNRTGDSRLSLPEPPDTDSIFIKFGLLLRGLHQKDFTDIIDIVLELSPYKAYQNDTDYATDIIVGHRML